MTSVIQAPWYRPSLTTTPLCITCRRSPSRTTTSPALATFGITSVSRTATVSSMRRRSGAVSDWRPVILAANRNRARGPRTRAC